MNTPLIPVILCGGTGTRLWPLSRASYPKQYWPLGGSGEETLLQPRPNSAWKVWRASKLRW